MTTKCELCNSTSGVESFNLSRPSAGTFDTSVLLCSTCRGQIENPGRIESDHWHCLQESMWSESPAVKVLAWRVLTKLSRESWAQELLEQLYLEDDVLQWAQEGQFEEQAADESSLKVKDSNGTLLSNGDSVTLIKDLDVKGAGFTAKRGTLVKNITLTDNPGLIEGRVNGTLIVLKTEFLKKA